MTRRSWPSQSDTVSWSAPAPGGAISRVSVQSRSGLGEPGRDLLAREAEPAMRLGLAQELEAVRREIDDQQAPARGEEPCRLAQGPGRIVEVVQHLVDDDEVEGAAGEGRGVDVALAQLDPGRPAFSRLARATDSMAWLASSPTARLARGAEELQHAAGAGAEVEEAAGPASGRRRRGSPPRPSSSAAWSERTRSQFGARRSKKAARRDRRLRPHLGEASAVAGEPMVGAVEGGEQRRAGSGPRRRARRDGRRPRRPRDAARRGRPRRGA